MDKKIKKILSARKTIKKRIEDANLSSLEKSEHLEEMQKPLLEQTKAIVSLAQQPQPQPIAQLPQLPQPPQPEKIDVATMTEGSSDLWVQEIVRNFVKSKPTKFEINTHTGELGLGKVDLAKLYNNNALVLINKEKKHAEVSRDFTKGLAVLLLVPYVDIKSTKIPITERDKIVYREIMKYVGFQPSASKKYDVLIRKYTKVSETEEDSDEEVHNTTPTNKPVKELIKPAKFGTGVCLPESQWESRLGLLLGSLQAGNTSKAVKEEIRQILDGMLDKKKITPSIHKKFYQQYI